MDRPTRRKRLTALATRAALAAVVWAILVEGRADAWLFGLPVVIAATLASLWLRPPEPLRLRPAASLRALVWFLGRSLVAGVDVAARALRPRMPLAPGFMTIRTRLKDPAARVLLADALTLLPGTLSAGLQDEAIELHVLDRGAPIEQNVRELEGRIAESFGESLAGR